MKIIQVAKPYIPKEDIKKILKKVEKILKGGMLMQGKYVKEFEEIFAKSVGVKYAKAVNSGTYALQGILNSFDLKGKEVLVPVNTFLATANTVLFEGGIPVFVEMNPDTLCMDINDLKKKINKRTKGVIAVHLSGFIQPDIEKIKALCKKHKIFLIEDASHAAGSEHNKQKAGSIGEAAAFSMLATKIITSGGEGGMVTTNNKKIAERIKSLRFHGEDKKRGLQNRIGHSWRMTEIQALIGITQIKRLKEIVRKRIAIAKKYDKAFKDLPKVKTITVPGGDKNAYYKYPLILDKSLKRSKIKEKLLKDFGVKTGTSYWPPCHLQPAYIKQFGYKKGDFPVAEDVLNRTISLPVYAEMKNSDIKRVIEGIKKVCV